MRRLNRQVLAGGVIHPAGTPATDDLEALVVNEDFWVEDDIDVTGPQEPTEEVDVDGPSEREKVLVAEVEKLVAEVDRLNAENDDLRNQLASASADAAPEDPAPAETDKDDTPPTGEEDAQVGAPEARAEEDYSEYGVKELKAELKVRNQGRETPIEVAEPGNKPELIDALKADDAAQAQA